MTSISLFDGTPTQAELRAVDDHCAMRATLWDYFPDYIRTVPNEEERQNLILALFAECALTSPFGLATVGSERIMPAKIKKRYPFKDRTSVLRGLLEALYLYGLKVVGKCGAVPSMLPGGDSRRRKTLSYAVNAAEQFYKAQKASIAFQCGEQMADICSLLPSEFLRAAERAGFKCGSGSTMQGALSYGLARLKEYEGASPREVLRASPNPDYAKLFKKEAKRAAIFAKALNYIPLAKEREIVFLLYLARSIILNPYSLFSTELMANLSGSTVDALRTMITRLDVTLYPCGISTGPTAEAQYRKTHKTRPSDEEISVAAYECLCDCDALLKDCYEKVAAKWGAEFCSDKEGVPYALGLVANAIDYSSVNKGFLLDRLASDGRRKVEALAALDKSAQEEVDNDR